MFPNVLVKLIKLPVCNEAIKEKFENCIQHFCYEEMTTMFGKYASQLVIHGINSSNRCAITQGNQRFFILKEDLKFFYDLKNSSQSGGSSFGGSGTKTSQTYKFSNIECTVESRYKNIPKTSHLIEIKPSEISKYGITTTINGKIYAAKDGGAINFDYDLVIEDFKIIKGPIEECKKRRVTLFQELQKQGHMIFLEVPKYKNLPSVK